MLETRALSERQIRHARIGQCTPQRMCFAARAAHLKATVVAEKGIGDVLLRKFAPGRHSDLPRFEQD